jgi:PAS domain S-box-containing protein
MTFAAVLRPAGATRYPNMSVLQIIHLEPRDADAELLEQQLRAGEIAANIVRVRNEQEFSKEIERPELHLILADCARSPQDRLSALAIAKEKRPEVPFLLVSDAIDRPQAIESLTAGATDLVSKGNLADLIAAVRRAIGESQTRRELLSARETLRAQSELLDLTSDSIILCDSEGMIQYWNRASQRIYGWTREEAVGQNLHRLLQTQFPPAAADWENTLRQQSHWEGELQQVRRDGVRINVVSHWTLKGSSPDSARLLINTDVAARENAEKALRRSEERHRRFVDEDLTGNLIMRPDGSILTCNPAFVRSFGFASVLEALDANFFSLLRNRKDGAELFAAVRQDGWVERHELEMRQPGGDPVYVAARFVATSRDDGELSEIQGYLFNDTRRKRLEQQLIQAQKMEGLGTLAGGIAHDFNNILAIILGYASQLEARSSKPDQLAGAVKVIKDAVERGAALVQQLLTSARQAEARFSPLDVNALLQEVEKMLQATFPKMINFELNLQPNFPSIKADRSQIHQVLLNLCVNARDALPNGGSIFLETSIITGAQIAESFTGAEAAEYACIRVRDTGTGMTPDVKAHIFEPFFTTKERAKGTGLGLSVVYGVVNNHHGFVQVETEPNIGTTFNIYLPVERGEGETTDSYFPSAPKTREPQTILLVEDEEMLRDLGIEILQGEGYRVIAARDGVEAVDLFTAHRDEIGLVVCDLGLPRLGGRDAFMKMKEIKPSVRAIVASGYLEPSMRSEILKAGVIDTIQKPYDFREMVEKIRSVIGKAQSEDDHPQLF